jgi:hypothetical protein
VTRVSPRTVDEMAAALYERAAATDGHEAEDLWRAAADAGHVGARRNIDELAKLFPEQLANL